MGGLSSSDQGFDSWKEPVGSNSMDQVDPPGSIQELAQLAAWAANVVQAWMLQDLACSMMIVSCVTAYSATARYPKGWLRELFWMDEWMDGWVHACTNRLFVALKEVTTSFNLTPATQTVESDDQAKLGKFQDPAPLWLGNLLARIITWVSQEMYQENLAKSLASHIEGQRSVARAQAGQQCIFLALAHIGSNQE
eukprot:1148771-Pelagomonas_calceolata.AAC.8